MIWPEPKLHLQIIADSIKRLSDFYIKNPEAGTPWHETFCQTAYRYYYLPLNLVRAHLVIKRGKQVGYFQGLNNFIDWGCGPGTFSLALLSDPELKTQIRTQTLFDISNQALNSFSDLHSELIGLRKTTSFQTSVGDKNSNTALIFSYSLTENFGLPPKGFENFESLIILEPSTSEDGRRLMELRQNLIEKGFFIWAPCTHHDRCPLLTESKHDWCHDRAEVLAPDWFLQLENLLPMRNRTVTTSYLLARKKNPQNFSGAARLIGDSKEEKGKTRQLVCRGPQREFLSWMHKQIEPQVLPRGELIKWPDQSQYKANEIRIAEKIQVL